jgi:hypothetical protein
MEFRTGMISQLRPPLADSMNDDSERKNLSSLFQSFSIVTTTFSIKSDRSQEDTAIKKPHFCACFL